MIYIDVDADLNMEDGRGRNVARVPVGVPCLAVGNAVVAGRPQFWSWAVIDVVEENHDGTAGVVFHQVSARQAASVGPLVAGLPHAV